MIGVAADATQIVKWKGMPIGAYAVWVQYSIDGKTAVTNPAMICFEPKD